MGGEIDARAGWAHVYRTDLFRVVPPASRPPKRRRRRRTGAALAALALALALTAPVALKAATLASTGASFAVTSTSDAVDASAGDGVCRTTGGACTLRAAIQQANALPGADTITVPAGTYELAIAPLNQNLAENGDLDITDSVTISGAGASSTIVDGGVPKPGAPPQVHGLDRLFEVLADGGTVTFSGLTLRDGSADEHGGAIANSSTATVTVVSSTLTGNVAGKSGGAIDNHLDGTLEVRNSTLSDNYAPESGSALNNNRGGVLIVTDSTVSTNSAGDVGLDENLVGAGAIANNAELDARGTITVRGTRIDENRAGGGRSGAAISNDGAGTVTVVETTFSKNHAVADGGAIFNADGEVAVANSTFAENSGKDGGAIASSGLGSLRVVDSTFSKNSATDWGGAIQNGNKGSTSIRSSTFTENSALNGGGFANEGSGLVTVESSTFTKNLAIDTAVLAGGEGGGIHSNSGGEIVVTNSVLSENRALSGGGISNEGGGQITITGTRISANRAEEAGGGILIQSGDVRIVDVDVVGNVSDSLLEGGGGISYAGDKVVSVGETAAIENSRIRDNTAKGDGGGIDSRGDGPLVITATAVTGNRAATGGAIHHVGDAPLEVTRSTLSGNSAENGGGIFSDGDGEATVENSTISGNRAAQFGGGLLVSSRLVVRSSTVAANSAPSGGGINNGGGDLVGDGTVFLANTIVAASPTGGNCAGTMTSRGGNLDSANTCQFRELSDQPGTDPRLGPLASNGGLTQTHALLAGSPAQENADCTELDPCPAVDQRGIARPVFAGFDVGAYESESAPSGGGDPVCAGRTERPVPAEFDSWISQSTASTNFGADSILKTKSQNGGNQRALVHFELPQAPPGCELVGATLRMHSSAATDGRTLEALRIGAAWTEAGVTWSNQPPTAGPAASTESGLDLREWDVLAQARDMYTHGDHGFLLRDAAENATGEQSFHSREKGADRPPELILVFDDPDGTPAPGACGTTSQSLSADRDSWVSQGSPSNNFGNDSTLKVKSQGGTNSRVLVRFPLPALPNGCTGIASATLRLEAASAKEGRTLEAARIGSDWSETGVTWANQPGTNGPAATTPSAEGPLEWPVTAQVIGMYTSANHGFLVRDAEENGVGDEQTLNSRTKLNDGPPELVLVFDDSAPETTIDSGPPSPTENSNAVFTFSSDRVDAKFECSLDGATFAACISPQVYREVPEGAHTFRVRATSNVRAVDPTPASHDWTVAVPPETWIEGPDSPSAYSSTIVSFSADDPTATFECALDEEAFETCTSPVEYTNLADGRHEVRVRATDPVGNVEPEPASHAWTVAVPPETTIDSGPAELSNLDSAEFTFSADEDGSTFECRLDDGDWATCTSPQIYPGVVDGRHAFAVRATDPAGNTDQSPASRTWTVDTTAPSVTIDSGSSGLTSDSTPTFTFTAEAGAGFECRLGAGDFAACSSPYDVTEPLADGAYTFWVRATDAAGNAGDPASLAFTVDTQGPVVVLAGPSGLTNDDTPTFTFTGEAGADFECRLGLGEFAPCTSPYDVTERLADGAYAFEVAATDAAGNTGHTASLAFTVDTQAPVIALDGPSGLTNDDTPGFGFSAADATWFQCSLGGAPFAACTSPYQVNDPLADGAYTFSVTASDEAGNESAAGRSFTVDTSAPALTIDSGPEGLTREASPSFGFSAEEGASVLCKLEAAEFEPCTSPYQVAAPLADGAYTFSVTASDEAGNESAAGRSFTVDTQGPVVTLAGPSGVTRDDTPGFEFSAADATGFQCSLDGAAYAGCDSPYEVTEPLADGPYTFEVSASDAAGNTGDPASLAFVVDTIGPAVALAGPNGLSNDNTPTFTFAAEAGASFECRFAGALFAACESPYEVTEPLADGTHTFEVRGTDAAGNTGDIASLVFTLDTQGPATALAGPSGLTNDNTPTFTFTAQGNVDFACRLGAGVVVPCSSPYQLTEPLADGGYTFEVRATDGAGNTGDAASLEFTVDTIAPVTTIGSGPDNPTTARSAQFTFNADDAGASFQCRLDTGPWEPCISGHTYGGPLALTDHLFQVKATDTATNEGAPDSYAWTIEAPDTTAPVVTILTGPDNPTTARSAQFTWSVDDAGASAQCKLDIGDWAACTSGITYPGPLTLGEHLFQVKATDTATNEGAPDSYAWTIEAPDTTAPVVTILTGPDNPTTARSAQFTWSVDDAGASAQCKLDIGDWAACTSGITYPGPLTLGEHLFQVKATDTATNEGAPDSYAWTIEAPDTTAPVVTILTGPDNPTTARSAQFTWSVDDAGASAQCKLDIGDWAACTSGITYPGPLTLGEHLFQVKATDTATNEGAPDSYAWTIEAPDTTAPVVTILTGPDNPTTARSAQFTWSVDDAGASAQCKLDIGDWAACTSGITYPGPLTLGEHLFQVKATDTATNEGAPDSYAWTIEAPDTTAPVVTILTGPDNPTTARSAQFTWSVDDAGASAQCKLDIGDWAACTSGITYPGPLTLGEHLFQVKATDTATNEGAPDSYAWTIEAVAPPPDTTEPVVTITSGPSSGTATTATFEFTANEPITGYRCSLDDGPLADCASGVSYTGLAAGSHTFQVEGRDAAGNVGSATWSWTVTSSPPPPSCTQQTVTVSPNADTWLLESSGTSNYGSDSAIKVDTKAGANARSLVRFALPATPSGCTLNDARLRLYAGSYKQGRTLRATQVASNWSEQGVTWNTQPAMTGAAATASSGSGYIQWAVTSQLAGASGNFSFLIADTTEGGSGIEQGFHSREKGSDNPPQLVLTFG